MSKEITEMQAQIAALTALVGQLVTVVAAQPAAADSPAPASEATSFDVDKDFAAKFDRQKGKAAALAKRSGIPAKLVAVQKGAREYQVWYMGNNRKTPANGTLLVTYQPDGATKTHIKLGNLKVA